MGPTTSPPGSAKGCKSNRPTRRRKVDHDAFAIPTAIGLSPAFSPYNEPLDGYAGFGRGPATRTFSMSTENSQMPYHPSDAYCPNGSCDWLKLLTIAIPFSVLAAFVLAVVITPVFVTGICAIIVPVIAGAVLGCVAERLFRLAHCRNPKVAAGLGILLGTTMFLGSYHAYFVWSKGVGRRYANRFPAQVYRLSHASRRFLGPTRHSVALAGEELDTLHAELAMHRVARARPSLLSARCVFTARIASAGW